MKKLALLLAAFSIVSFTFTTSADLIITEVMSSSSHPGGMANGDWFEIFNSGGSPVDISFYTWDDAGSAAPGVGRFTNATFLTYSVAALDTVIISEESQANVDDGTTGFKVSWGLGAEVDVIGLGSTIFQAFSAPNGDTVNVWNASSELVVQRTFGASVQSNSFAYDSAGNYLGQSAVGQYGAWQALGNGAGGAGTDVASPGYVYIPEPSTVIFMGSFLTLGALCQWLRRFKRAAS